MNHIKIWQKIIKINLEFIKEFKIMKVKQIGFNQLKIKILKKEKLIINKNKK